MCNGIKEKDKHNKVEGEGVCPTKQDSARQAEGDG